VSLRALPTWLAAVILAMACGSSPPVVSPSPTRSGGPSTDNFLAGVWCASPTDCTAVGHVARAFFDGGPHTRTLILEDAGEGWRIVPSPNDAASVGSKLRAVTCVGAGDCFAVGESESAASIPTPLIEHSTATGWGIIPSAVPANPGLASSLAGVACSSSTHCVAVGYYEASVGTFQTLIEETSGNGWRMVGSPDPAPAGSDELNAVTCPTRSLCIAVGAHHSGEHDQPLVEENSGDGWKTIDAPGSGGLDGIACPGPSDCVATGGELSVAGTNLYISNLVEQAANGVWKAISVSGLAGPVQGVACSSASYCLGVSSSGATAPDGSPIVAERVDGVWSAGGPAPVPNDIFDLAGVACPGDRICIAVGDQILGNDADYERPHATFIAEHASGGWTVQPSPNV
jgi:hypothetical protein